MATFPVEDVKFSGQTAYNNRVLEVNKDELAELVLQDKRVASADLDVAFPGEQTRIVKLRDAVEPRVKVSGPGCVFPGILGPVETVGEGRTHRLSGITVMPSAEYHPTILSGTEAQSAGVVDMWGPGAQVTPFGSTINIVLMLKLINGVTELEAHSAIQSAEFRVAHRLAEITRGMTPEDMEVFELFEVGSSLPRVGYVLTCLTEWHQSHSLVAYYGLPIRESLPTFIHPNELFDGALTVDARRGGGINTTSWTWMNQPVILELLRQHGKQLNFLGVILQRTRFETEFGKQVTAVCTSQMARLLGADGVVITRTVTSGNNFMDVMLTVQSCERKGIKTVFLTPEWGGKDGNELPLAFYVPEATAMVSTGSFERDVVVPAPTKVIGVGDTRLVEVYAGDKSFSPWGEIRLPSSFLMTGGVDWFGYLNLTCTEY
ncbi:MAG: glycine/sarcosine/betaine reductase component B subunit [Candidatus Binatia bacterium]